MKFLAMHITNQKLSFDIFTVGNLSNEIGPLVSQVLPSHASHFDAHEGIYLANAFLSPIIRINPQKSKNTTSEHNIVFAK